MAMNADARRSAVQGIRLIRTGGAENSLGPAWRETVKWGQFFAYIGYYSLAIYAVPEFALKGGDRRVFAIGMNFAKHWCKK